MASLGRSANVSKMQAKRARSRLSGKTVPAATRAAHRVCVCIERPPLGIKACCHLLLSYYPLPALLSTTCPSGLSRSSRKLWVMVSLQWDVRQADVASLKHSHPHLRYQDMQSNTST